MICRRPVGIPGHPRACVYPRTSTEHTLEEEMLSSHSVTRSVPRYAFCFFGRSHAVGSIGVSYFGQIVDSHCRPAVRSIQRHFGANQSPVLYYSARVCRVGLNTDPRDLRYGSACFLGWICTVRTDPSQTVTTAGDELDHLL